MDPIWYFLIVIILVTLTQIIEIYAYFVKGAASAAKGRQLIGLANWIQYFARILYVIVLLLLTFIFEVLNYSSLIIPSVAFAFFLSFIFSICLCLSNKALYGLQLLLQPLIRYTYPELINMEITVDQSKIKFNKTFYLSLLTSFLIGIAFIVPFYLAHKFPEYRMMATYSGQFLNFFATAIIFSIIEPKMYIELDSSDSNLNTENGLNYVVCSSAISIINAKILSQIMIVIAVILLVINE